MERGIVVISNSREREREREKRVRLVHDSFTTKETKRIKEGGKERE